MPATMCMAAPLIAARIHLVNRATQPSTVMPLCQSLPQPVEFCSDVFLLPLGSPPQDTLDSLDSDDEGGDGRSPPLPPSPPPLDPALYELLLKSLDNNNVPPPPRAKKSRTKAKWEEDTAEHFI